MRRSAIRPIVVFVAAALIGSRRAAAQEDISARLSRAYTAIQSAVDALPPLPGMVVGVTDRNGTLRVFTHGYEDVKTKQPVTAASLFEIGSISKSFTAIALMQLFDEGRFDPKAPVTTYLPWFATRSAFAPVTGHHLLTHTAGLPNYRPDVASMPYATYALRDFAPSYAPGEHFWYSNIGFQTLGYVLEEIERAPYRAIVERRLFAPLQMTSSAAVITDEIRRKLPASYGRRLCDTAYLEEPWFEYRAADGSIASTIGDMLAYTRLLLNRGATPGGRVLSERAFTALTTPPTGNYAYGLNVRMQGGNLEISHGGAIAGFSSQMLAEVNHGFGVVALANAPLNQGMIAFCSAEADLVTFPFTFERVGASDPVTGVWYGPDWFAGAAYRGPKTLPPPPAELLPFVGRYENHNPEGAAVRIFVRNGQLFFASGRSPAPPLVRLGPNLFRPAEPVFNPERLQFDAVVGGRALRLVYSGMPMYRVDDR